MPSRVAGLTRGTLETAPSVCRDCVWWQSRGNRTASKERWIERVEEEHGEWGTIYYDDDGSVLGSMQYGAAGLFPRADDLPAGPPSDDAVLVTCAYLIRTHHDWVLKSLLLAAIGEARDQGARALEAFAYRYPEREAPGSAAHRPPHRLPARLPRGVRVRNRALPGARRALPARARRARSRRGGPARTRAPRRAGGVHAGGVARAAGALTRAARPPRAERIVREQGRPPTRAGEHAVGLRRRERGRPPGGACLTHLRDARPDTAVHVRPHRFAHSIGRRGHRARRARAGPAGGAAHRRRGVRRRAGALRARRPPRARPLLVARARPRARAHEGTRTSRADRSAGRRPRAAAQRADAPPSPPPLRHRRRRARRGALGPARPARRQARAARPALPRLRRRPRPRGRGRLPLRGLQRDRGGESGPAGNRILRPRPCALVPRLPRADQRPRRDDGHARPTDADRRPGNPRLRPTEPATTTAPAATGPGARRRRARRRGRRDGGVRDRPEIVLDHARATAGRPRRRRAALGPSRASPSRRAAPSSRSRG